jgi:hypothetical protein
VFVVPEIDALVVAPKFDTLAYAPHEGFVGAPPGECVILALENLRREDFAAVIDKKAVIADHLPFSPQNLR